MLLEAAGLALLGAVTGVGGGTIRDIFLAHLPRVLQSDIYATAALVGAVILIVIRGLVFRRHLGRLPVAFVALVSQSLRFISTGICRASRIRSHLEHGENLEGSQRKYPPIQAAAMKREQTVSAPALLLVYFM
jgi:hypothetical protein